ncbi:MAG TPA: hypothetical protein VHI11_06235, partial [Jiangellaceae bacterium]|nr:hypothetical protein [Jiangellaceae bacterium]
MPDGTSLDTADVLAVDAAVTLATGSEDFGITRQGFVPKSFARLLAEKLALARALFGDDLDLTSGSAIRKLLEVSALEDARTWAALGTFYDNAFVGSATGDALSRLGDELGLARPFLEAHGTVTLTLQGTLPTGMPTLAIPRGARLLTSGGHHVATDERVVLSATSPQRQVAVVAFYPGPDHNLDPSRPEQRIDRWNTDHLALSDLLRARAEGEGADVVIEHADPLVGGELQWPDVRYRDLLLRAPRSIWTSDAIQIAAALVPGVRQVLVRDALGGLDINQSIFGNFNFVQRLFSSERDVGSPYYLTVLVAPTPSAIWDGPDGVRIAVESAIEDLRPISIFPKVDLAAEVGVGVAAEVTVSGLPLPSGSPEQINASAVARSLKSHLLGRVRAYIDGLSFGEPVRAAEVVRALL